MRRIPIMPRVEASVITITIRFSNKQLCMGKSCILLSIMNCTFIFKNASFGTKAGNNKQAYHPHPKDDMLLFITNYYPQYKLVLAVSEQQAVRLC